MYSSKDNVSLVPKPPKLPGGKRHDQVYNPKKIFVGGLRREITQQIFRDYWSKYGILEDCVVMMDPETNKTRGFGFVVFKDSTIAKKILDNPDDFSMQGRKLDIKPAIPRSKGHTSNTSHGSHTGTSMYKPSTNNNSGMPNHHIKDENLRNYNYNYNGYPPTTMNSEYKQDNNTGMNSVNPSNINTVKPNNSIYVDSRTQRGTTHPTSFYPYGDYNYDRKHYSSHDRHHSDYYRDRDRDRDGYHHRSSHRRDRHTRRDKLFVGGLSESFNAKMIKEYFEKNFGDVLDCVVMYDQNGNSRRFGFITFTDPNISNKVLLMSKHTINNVKITVEKAIPRNQIESYKKQQQQTNTVPPGGNNTHPPPYPPQYPPQQHGIPPQYPGQTSGNNVGNNYEYNRPLPQYSYSQPNNQYNNDGYRYPTQTQTKTYYPTNNNSNNSDNTSINSQTSQQQQHNTYQYPSNYQYNQTSQQTSHSQQPNTSSNNSIPYGPTRGTINLMRQQYNPY